MSRRVPPDSRSNRGYNEETEQKRARWLEFHGVCLIRLMNARQVGRCGLFHGSFLMRCASIAVPSSETYISRTSSLRVLLVKRWKKKLDLPRVGSSSFLSWSFSA